MKKNTLHYHNSIIRFVWVIYALYMWVRQGWSFFPLFLLRSFLLSSFSCYPHEKTVWEFLITMMWMAPDEITVLEDSQSSIRWFSATLGILSVRYDNGGVVTGHGTPRTGHGITWKAHASVICLQHHSLPPSPQRNWTSKPKKKKCPPPSPLCQGVNQTLKRPANKRSYNRGKRLGSYRQ